MKKRESDFHGRQTTKSIAAMGLGRPEAPSPSKMQLAQRAVPVIKESELRSSSSSDEVFLPRTLNELSENFITEMHYESDEYDLTESDSLGSTLTSTSMEMSDHSGDKEGETLKLQPRHSRARRSHGSKRRSTLRRSTEENTEAADDQDPLDQLRLGSDYYDGDTDFPEERPTPSSDEIEKFFENFGPIPDINDIVESESESDLDDETRQSGFVEPVTEDFSDSYLEMMKLADGGYEETEPDREGAEGEETEDWASRIDGDLQSTEEDAEIQDFEIQFAVQMEEEAVQPMSILDMQEIKLEEERKQREAKDRESIVRLINEMVDVVTELCEEFAIAHDLKRNLDKHKLILAIRQLKKEIEPERRVNNFLKRKATEYFRRKGNIRNIIDDNLRHIVRYSGDYRKALERLDSLLGLEQRRNQEIQDHLIRLNAKLADRYASTESIENEFANLLHECFSNEKHIHLMANVDTHLKRFKAFRNEISEVRFRLIVTGHELTHYEIKYDEMQDLGGGLRLCNYEHLVTENLTISNKIDERTMETNKLYKRFRRDIQALGHIKEYKSLLQNFVIEQQRQFNLLLDDKYSLRRSIYNLKRDRIKVKEELNALRAQCGLLDMPYLMHDYDKSMKRVGSLRFGVRILRFQHATLLKKIARLERRCQD